MKGIEALGAIGLGADPLITRMGISQSMATPGASQISFGQILSGGIDKVESKVATANDLVRQFAVDDSIPLHQVTFALEEARLAVELAMQVRGRLLESYRELMNMQL
jgi:flagellar hook-basal body complex protein FliE